MWFNKCFCNCLSTYNTRMRSLSSVLTCVYVDSWLVKKPFLHISLRWRRYPVWVDMCVFRLLARVNAFSHIPHWCGRSPVWVNMCLVRWPFRVNVFLHISHRCGRSPVWDKMCLFRRLFCVNAFLHPSQQGNVPRTLLERYPVTSNNVPGERY